MLKMDNIRQEKRRLDYKSPEFTVTDIDLTFELDMKKTVVTARSQVVRLTDDKSLPLVLAGEELKLRSVTVNGAEVAYTETANSLTLSHVPDSFEIVIVTEISPSENSALMGLYVSDGKFCTQCEPEGFRRITFFLDRSDVLAKYTTHIIANEGAYHCMLSNGNCISDEVKDGKRIVSWQDPFPKPSYLFALVAGDFDDLQADFTTSSGRKVDVHLYGDKGQRERGTIALDSILKAMALDESRFELQYDLNRFMVVAVDFFNAGGMENKGLNIFNSKFVLADAESATDTDIENVLSVIGHEYFHNWTGDRVTCRDWFQLSLKEGLTVFRDQEFSMDMAATPSARAVKRIEDVRVLRTAQFPEDAGPMAHPVRPDSYVEINNFYTLTIYEKGAEVVRMQHNLVGRDGFAQGIKRYFEHFDGQAVTCDDFVQCMADANPASPLNQHLEQFKRWYSQAGPPQVHASGVFDADSASYTPTLRQTCPATPGQSDKQPFVIPVTLGLLSAQGQALPLQLQGQESALGLEHTLVLTEAEQSWTFTGLQGLDGAPVPSLLRGFSAPVQLHYAASDAELLTQLAHDSDAFNRWEAGQRLMLRSALHAIQEIAVGADLAEICAKNYLQNELVQALRAVLLDSTLDPAFKELALTLPSESYIAEQLQQPVDPQHIHAVRQAMRLQLASALQADWQATYEAHTDTGAYRPEPHSAGRRALAGLALSMLCLAAQASGDSVWPGKAYQRFKQAGNLTDRIHALNALIHSASALAEPALERFYRMAKDEALDRKSTR